MEAYMDVFTASSVKDYWNQPTILSEHHSTPFSLATQLFN